MGLAASKQEAFWEACGFGHVDRVRKFLQEDIDVNWKSYTHDCCAIHVASQGKPEIVQMLLDVGCDVNVRDDRGNLALHHAAMKGEADIMKTLIKAGSEINAQDKNGWSSLHCAAYWAHPKAARALIEAGIDIHLQNKDQRTALHETARSKENLDVELGEITRDLIQAGCDINTKSKDDLEADFTPLMFAAYHGHPEVASALIDAGCDLNARGTNLWTALHWATDRGNEEVVYILLEAGADPTCQGMRGELAAHRAQSNPDLKEMLLNAVNMYTELSSLGGANSQPGSQATSPTVEKGSAVTILASPMAQTETLSDKDGSSDELTSEQCGKGSENVNELGKKVVSDAELSPKKSSKDDSVNSLSERLGQEVNLNENSTNSDENETSSLSSPTESYDEAAILTKGDNHDVALESAEAANEHLCDTSDVTRTGIGEGDGPVPVDVQKEDSCVEKLNNSEKSSNDGNTSQGDEVLSKIE
ncbi:ankyrin repeat domain-containing protein 6-like [Liolophura sinensis]|uniref:ankyrin repeat domain-containing protein 6-like n=1 Tax=Liolophura sinensis TaxID=3198878 RepID=UPI0031584C42